MSLICVYDVRNVRIVIRLYTVAVLFGPTNADITMYSNLLVRFEFNSTELDYLPVSRALLSP